MSFNSNSSPDSQAGNYVEPYSPVVYNTVTTSLGAAVKKLEERDATPFLFTQVRDCFLKHNVEMTFSAFLIHKHFPLADNERNIEKDGKAIASSDLDNIMPSSWIYHNSKCYPMEYKRSEMVPQPPRAFVEDYGRLLQSAGFTGLFGFQVYTDGVLGLESTTDKTSTTVEQDESEPVPEGMAPASWAFFREPDVEVGA